MIAIYLLTFFSTVQYALVVYINSSFLNKFIPNGEIGLVYTLASVVAIICVSEISYIMEYIGQFRLAFISLIGTLIALFAFAATDLKIIPEILKNFNVIIFFVVFFVTSIFNRYFLDFYLKELTTERNMGRAQGMFLTIMNTAIAVSPAIVGLVLIDGYFYRIYLAASLTLLIAMTIFYSKLSTVPEVLHISPPFFKTAKKILRDKNLYSIFSTNFLLEFFYSWMTIYTPIYLNKVLGFSWGEIGPMFSIMLTSFIILQFPLGKIADLYLGEKEILTIGFIIIAIATSLLSFITVKSFWLWTGALFLTRVGASAIEVMNETYFYKKVRAVDSDIMSFYRNASPLAYIAGPLLASVFFVFFDFKFIFLVLGMIMLIGTYFSLSIKDTK